MPAPVSRRHPARPLRSAIVAGLAAGALALLAACEPLPPGTPLPPPGSAPPGTGLPPPDGAPPGTPLPPHRPPPDVRPAGTWVLQSLGGQPFRATATLRIDGQRVEGEGPCNSYSGRLQSRWPEFRLGALRATERACADFAAEERFFAALSQVTRASRSGNTLTLTGPRGVTLVFRRAGRG